MLDEDVQSEYEIVENPPIEEGHRPTYDLEVHYLQSGERWSETILEDMYEEDLWDYYYTFKQFLEWKFPEKWSKGE